MISPIFVSRMTDSILASDAEVAVEGDRESAGLAAKILPHSIVMSQKQKSEGEIRRSALVKGVLKAS